MRQGRAAAVLGVLVVAIGGYLFWAYNRAPPQSAGMPVAAGSSTAAAAYASTAPEHPISQVVASQPATATTSLPPLRQSDGPVSESLISLLGKDRLLPVLVDSAIIPRAVATVDALPRKELVVRNLPLIPAHGGLITMQVGGRTVIAPADRQRFAPYMQLLAAVETDAVVGWYVRRYPLFQQAYEDLGYPDAYFNDRLIEVIDHLLAAPEASEEPVVVAHKGLWLYADPRLESRSTGQKLLLRIGPEYAATVKARLRELREQLVTAPQALPPVPAG